MKKSIKNKKENLSDDEKFPLPIYSEDEDIYKKEKENEGIQDLSEDLDVPGAELDDADEILGEEDEENNYYSLGGDDHNDLEEDKEEDR